jgi:hypothetical protein
MNWCTFHAYIGLGETDDTTFELALSQISKEDDALYSCPPKGWYIKEDVPGDFAIFRSPEMDELDKHMKNEGQKGVFGFKHGRVEFCVTGVRRRRA